MSFRIGECSSCGANYKLPATFEANQARCKSCGGTVQIGKVGEPAPTKAAPPVPATKPASSTSSQATPQPKKKREGPSMKERLMAERKAAAAKAASAKPEQVAKANTPASKPSTPQKATPARKSRTAGARSTSSRRNVPENQEAEGSKRSSGGRRRASSKPEKKAPVAGIIGLAVLVLGLGGGAWWYIGSDGSSEPVVEAAIDSEQAAANDATDLANEVSDGKSLTEEETGEQSDADLEPIEEGGTSETAATETPTKPAKKKPAPAGDPNSVDLTAISDFGPIAGCSEERFLELQELASTMIDPEAGAAGNRARNKLVAAGKESFPVIFNALKSLDLTDTDDFRSADVCQKALQELCNGNNFGWKYPSQEPEKFHYFDKKVIVSWSKAWNQAKDNDGAWAKLAKLDKIESAKGKDAPSPEEDNEDALDALDDL
jgi:hypothetical protein